MRKQGLSFYFKLSASFCTQLYLCAIWVHKCLWEQIAQSVCNCLTPPYDGRVLPSQMWLFITALHTCPLMWSYNIKYEFVNLECSLAFTVSINKSMTTSYKLSDFKILPCTQCQICFSLISWREQIHQTSCHCYLGHCIMLAIKPHHYAQY